MFIDGEDGNLQYGHDEELHRAGFTQDSPKGDQDCSCAEVCIDYSAGRSRKGHKKTGDNSSHPRFMRSLVTGNDHVRRSWTYLKMLILILPWSKCQMPCMRKPHCRPKAARSRLMPTLLNPYRFRKVMRKPKPMKIMTWTSWNTAEMSGEVSFDFSYWDLTALVMNVLIHTWIY